jgi:hypothetical protein
LGQFLNLPGKLSKNCNSPFREDEHPSFSVFIDHDGFERWKDHATANRATLLIFSTKARGITNPRQAIAEFLALAGVSAKNGRSERR